MNHAILTDMQWFDPKIQDTLVLNENIRQALMDAYPGLIRKDMLGSWFGLKEYNADIDDYERTRYMRGETQGYAYLYETDYELPSGIDGYKYWEALDILKSSNRIKHIVVVFPQIFADSQLNLVEIHNQIAKEIGYKSWLYWDEKDYDTYPGVGHPFSDYWGVWLDTECLVPGSSETEPCCFDMGGCPGTEQPYPPERQTPLDEALSVLDPSLVFDVSEYGNLGYDQSLGPPSADEPVQEQYTGTWVLWQPPSDNPKAGKYLAQKVFDHIMAK